MEIRGSSSTTERWHASRRSFIRTAAIGLAVPTVSQFGPVQQNMPIDLPAVKGIVLTGLRLYTVKINERGDWHFLELSTNKGVKGIGECSHAFPKTSVEGNAAVQKEALALFELVRGKSPFTIEQFRQKGFALADNKLKRTVFSGIEQALWDLCGKILSVPVYSLLGGKLRDRVRVYANINRATNERSSNGKRPVSAFQKNAEQALQAGFTAVKLAPFDEMRPLSSATPAQIDEDIRYAVSCIEGVRSMIGADKDLLIDVHSHLDTTLAIQTANRIAREKLYWFEEPVDPFRYPKETLEIRRSIPQVLAGGEAIFGLQGYLELLYTGALGIIMPDVKHCGGLLELRHIAALAEATGKVQVAPHNPSGPVATAASVAVCAGISNFAILEYAFGEVPWSSQLVLPAEQFSDGHLTVSDAPGLGISLHHDQIQKHL